MDHAPQILKMRKDFKIITRMNALRMEPTPGNKIFSTFFYDKGKHAMENKLRISCICQHSVVVGEELASPDASYYIK